MQEYFERITVQDAPRLPLEGSIDLTYRCNNTCRHCWISIPANSSEQKNELTFDVAFMALGVQPSRIFRDSGIPTGEDGGLLVNSFLQSVSYPEMFGGGDCVSFSDRPLAKVGVYAVRQNPILYHNLLAALEGRDMKAFIPQKDYMLIFNMGNGRGILWKRNFLYKGRLAFFLNDYIDRKFMKKFQVAGEADEKE